MDHRDHEHGRHETILHRLDHGQFEVVLKLLNKLTDGTAGERTLMTILTTLQSLNGKAENIMTAFSDFAAKQKAYNDRTGTAIDGIVADLKALNDKITELQNSAGQVTPEDQALIDDLQSKGEALATKAEQLDAQTPPPPPPG